MKSISLPTLSGKYLDEVAIERIREFEPQEGYWVAYSGGKDSDVILDLVHRAGVHYEAHHNLTTCDPPEVVRHVRNQPDVIIDRPPKTMWELIRQNGTLPMRNRRFCCRELKERGGSGRLVMTGVRWSESQRRASRTMVEHCYRDHTKNYLHPIIDWTTTDVWQYIKGRTIEYCGLYDEGFTRLGCVLCPMVRDTERQLKRWPQICRAWERAAKSVFKRESNTFTTAENYWQWWLTREARGPQLEGDMPLFFRD